MQVDCERECQTLREQLAVTESALTDAQAFAAAKLQTALTTTHTAAASGSSARRGADVQQLQAERTQAQAEAAQAQAELAAEVKRVVRLEREVARCKAEAAAERAARREACAVADAAIGSRADAEDALEHAADEISTLQVRAAAALAPVYIL